MSETVPQTILFADISGSTKLFEDRGDVEARRLIANVLGALSKIAGEHGGRVIKTIGDEIMCTFPGALNGLMAASDMQRKLARDIDFVRDNLAIRVGLHHGDALEEDGDVYGDAVNTAARMGSLAKREQIVTTAATVKDVNSATVRTRALGRARVSGKLLPIEIVDVMWQEDTSNVTTVQKAIRLGGADEEAGCKLTLRYKGQVLEITETSQPIAFGRDETCSMVVDSQWVSRNHAMIEFKRGYFVVSDRSTNGTFVKLADDEELRLHRDEMHLRKTGTISLGQAVALNENDVIYFQCSY